VTSASAARLAAARALVAVEGGAHLEEALDAVAPAAGSDRDLAWFLGYGVLRRRGQVDAALRAVLSQPLGALDPPVRAALRVGALELLFARTRRHAAVHQAVELVRELGCGRAHGLVNAVLRRLGPLPTAGPERMSEADELDHPAWLVERWQARYGAEATRRWCRDNVEPPPLFVVAKPGCAPQAGWAPVEVDGAPVPDVYRAPSGGPIPERPGFREGEWWVQDLASVRVADLLGPLPDGAVVLDACSAPGGKAYRLASRGARVVAADAAAERLVRLEEGAARLGLADAIETRIVDWRRPAPGVAERFDAILVDAPCTGLGTVRRHPEIRWRRTEPDLERSAALQAQILSAAAACARPGAALVYGVCSPEPEEGAEVVARLVAEDPRWQVEAVVLTAPPEQGEDAHYGARLRRMA
jgi:16S rRNA (cytosine967-C5)-methyltransferase